MKNNRSYLILASLISLLLACFPVSLYADEVIADSPSNTPSSIPYLDSYFYDNYDLLPYIESDGQQYIDTGIPATNNLRVDCQVSNILSLVDGINYYYYFGSYTSNVSFRVGYIRSSDVFKLYFGSGNQNYTNNFNQFSIIKFTLDQNKAYINNSLVNTFDESTFNLANMTIFAQNSGNGPANYSSFKLYGFSIYDYSANDGDGALVRYYYPAKSKSGGVTGLYDAVSKTFVTTGGSVPFQNPTDDKVLHFQISDFVTNGLGWIEQILDFAIEEPLIITFMAIGLCGVAIRWARRVVHF